MLTLSHAGSEVFVPDGMGAAQALSRTTHLGIAAHPDDLEIMAIHGILACHASESEWFTGVVATDGAGSPTTAGKPSASAGEIVSTRRAEQKRAAELGRYGALVCLNHSSAEVKDPTRPDILQDLVAVLRATSAGVVYTHNLADAHDTHVAVALAVIAACRSLDEPERPNSVIGCEVWRDLDWLSSSAKIAMTTGNHEDLEAELLRTFESQLEAGKRIDLGALGRRRAHAAFHEIHNADAHRGIVWGMDLTPAARGEIEPSELVKQHISAFASDVESRLRRFRR